MNNETFHSDYKKQVGFKITNNIQLKIKPFFYGRRMKEFKPIPDEIFSCHNQILGILADGSLVPCCLAYDSSIALGNVKQKNLFNILENNSFLKNLRDINGEKHITCKKCFGEPTNRGVFFRKIKFKFDEILGRI